MAPKVVNKQYVDMVVSPDIAVESDFTGIIAVTTAGTEVTGGDVPNTGSGFALKPHPDNTDTVWVMPVGRTKANGFPLNPGETIIVNIANLNLLDFDADVSGEKICWIKL